MPTGVYLRTEKHLEILRRLHRMPKTEKQLKASRRNGRKVGLLPKTEKHSENMRRVRLLALYRRGQNRKELFLENILKSLFVNHYKFTGDGSFIIGGCNPDFINCNGQKKIIELDGDYWHSLPGRKNDDRRRDRIYRSFGYSILRVKEKQLKNLKKLTIKLIKFHNA